MNGEGAEKPSMRKHLAVLSMRKHAAGLKDESPVSASVSSGSVPRGVKRAVRVGAEVSPNRANETISRVDDDAKVPAGVKRHPIQSLDDLTVDDFRLYQVRVARVKGDGQGQRAVAVGGGGIAGVARVAEPNGERQATRRGGQVNVAVVKGHD